MTNDLTDQQASKYNSLNNLSFPIQFKESGGMYIFSAPQLGLMAKSTTLEEAYSKFCEKKSHYIKEMIEIGEENEIPFDHTPSQVGTTVTKAKLSKYVVFRDFFVIVLMSGFLLTTSVAVKKSGKKLNRSLQKVVNASPAKELEYVERFKANLNKISPYAKTVKDYWNEL